MASLKMTFNRFDFLRLLFAGTVFVYHAIVLSDIAPGGALETILASLAELSIEGFFIISGALVFGSWTRSRGLADYTSKRVRRLYPAYVVIILIPALIAFIFSLQNGVTLATINHIARYLGANLVFLNFLEPTLPGLFESLKFPVVNGALWTLKIEVMFYLSVPALAWLMSRLGRLQWGFVLVLYISAEIWRASIPHLDIPYAEQIARQLPGQMSFFAAGMALWLVWDQARSQPSRFGLIGIVILAISFAPYLEPLRAVGLAGLIAFAAFAPGPPLQAGRWGDISYGVYITHFPIVNMLIMLGAFRVSMGVGLFLSVLLVTISSIILWRTVERPFLRRSSHYRQSDRTGA